MIDARSLRHVSWCRSPKKMLVISVTSYHLPSPVSDLLPLPPFRLLSVCHCQQHGCQLSSQRFLQQALAFDASLCHSNQWRLAPLAQSELSEQQVPVPAGYPRCLQEDSHHPYLLLRRGRWSIPPGCEDPRAAVCQPCILRDSDCRLTL